MKSSVCPTDWARLTNSQSYFRLASNGRDYNICHLPERELTLHVNLTRWTWIQDLNISGHPGIGIFN